MPVLRAEERIGTTLADRYRIDSILGEGGMGVVFAGEHTMTGRKVAIKLLQPSLVSDEDVIARFFQEAKAAAALDHPNVVDVLDMGVVDEDAFLTLELLEGESLGEVLDARGALPPEEALALLLPVIDALGAAHDQRILHRDIKPDNIFLARDVRGRVTPKVLDFGIAKLMEGEPGVQTKTGRLIGTPSYMSPEQARAAPDIGPPSDVWSIGVVLYECLTGTRPFAAASMPALLMQICSVDPVAIRERNSAIPKGIAEVTRRSLDRDLDHRYPTMEAFGAALVEAAAEGGLTVGGFTRETFAKQHVPRAVIRTPHGMAAEDAGLPTVHATPSPATAPAKVEAERSPLPFALAALVVVGLVAGLALWLAPDGLDSETTDSEHQRSAVPPPDAASSAEHLEAPVVEADAGSEERAPTRPVAEEVAQDADPAAQSRSVTVRSSPRDAQVFRAGTRVGRTPFTVEVAPGEQVELQLRAPGRRPRSVVLTADSPSPVDVSLARRRETEAPQAAPGLAPR